MSTELDCALDLIRRLPPQHIDRHIANICQLAPDLADELLTSVDQPLKVASCRQTSKDYLLCDYNRDGDSYRSPWSNEYDPPISDGNIPSAPTRKLEVAANEAFATYAYLYYEGQAITSCYFWDLDDGFAGVVLIKKLIKDDGNAAWDSIHVFEATERGRHAQYKLTSTIMLHMSREASGTSLSLAGNLTRQYEQEFQLTDVMEHVGNLGRFIEDAESRMRNSIGDLYFGKMKNVANDLRTLNGGLNDRKKQGDVKAELMAKLLARRKE